MKGKDLQKGIVDLARTFGYRVAHFTAVQDARGVWRTPAKADGVGWPDLFLVRPGRACAIEVKGDGDSLKPAQRDWLDALLAAGVESLVATPKGWAAGDVDRFLR